ncbi:MAG TPA: PrsW family intramembrane metalloprotease [Ruminococcaceae bacterium]|nr:PrsW family intramembrane metalloprotease [Oscillospiraceae bacterium]
MGNLNLILFISIVAPLAMMLLIYKGKSRTSLLFLLLGILVCLFCGEFSSLVMQQLPFDRRFFTVNFTPLFEEIFKAFPILVYSFLYKPKRQTLFESSIAVGVGFAILENAFILASDISQVSILLALIRGFGSGMMHGVCTLAVGYGMTFVYKRRKLFYTGTTALLSAAIIYHSVYNNLVQSEYQIIGFLLPIVTFLPLVAVLRKKGII